MKDKMVEVGKRTAHLSLERRGVLITRGHRINRWDYTGNELHTFVGPVIEGLGNKVWIARWMQLFGDGQSHMEKIAQDIALMSVNDNLPALPFAYADELTPRASSYFEDEVICTDFAQGTEAICNLCGMSLVGGETPNYKFLVDAFGEVDDAPVMSSSTVGIITNPDLNFITEDRLQPGDRIIAVKSSGWHANGASRYIRTRSFTLLNTS
jgi:phosphoribosylaminoimidazole (AIR) synthetase